MTKDHNTEQAVSETDALMTAIQEFASTYSLAGGRFDDGTMHDQAMAQKEEIRKSLYAALSQVRGKAQEPVAEVYRAAWNGPDIRPLIDWVNLPVGTKLYAAAPQVTQEQRRFDALCAMQTWPEDLHDETARLVMAFAAAMAGKLAAAQRKYGYSNGWTEPSWMDKCRTDLLEHVAKGDPRDVANYCAFLWFHNEKTSAPQVAQEEGARVPLIPNQAMRDVMDTEGWQWEDLLAAAGAITEEQYASIAAAPQPDAQQEVAICDDFLQRRVCASEGCRKSDAQQSSESGEQE